MSWPARTLPCSGSVLFRGAIPPRPEELTQLAGLGLTASARAEQAEDVWWALDLEHPGWGPAELVCWRQPNPLPSLLVEHDPRLSREEKDAALLGEAMLTLKLRDGSGHVLRDRKRLLRYLGAVMGDVGVVAVDHLAQRPWSRAALDDELAHDADVDIEALYTLHLVSPEPGAPATWLHSHGLAEVGAVDFDVLEPSPDLIGSAADGLRALAFAILEERLRPGGEAFPLVSPRGDVRLVPVAEFERRADARARALREADAEHGRDRCVVCEPAGRLARWFGGVKPSRLLSSPLGDDRILNFSTAASDLMAERARASYPLLRRLAEEFADLELPVAVKLGYEVDGGEPDEREHLWFGAHALGDSTIDATLASSPFRIAGMQLGARDSHPLERLSGWMIDTPFGRITPHHTAPARSVRAHRQELRQALETGGPA